MRLHCCDQTRPLRLSARCLAVSWRPSRVPGLAVVDTGRHQYLSCAERMADSHAIRPRQPVPRPLLSTTPLTHQADAAPMVPAPFQSPPCLFRQSPGLSWGNLVKARPSAMIVYFHDALSNPSSLLTSMAAHLSILLLLQ